MKLTGAQIREAANISDGAECILTRHKGQVHVDVHRIEDGLVVRLQPNGTGTILDHRQKDEDDGKA